MLARFILSIMLLVPAAAEAATGLANPTLTNFYQGDFTVAPNGNPTNVIKINLGMNRPPGNDLPGDLLTFIAIHTNLFVTNIFYTTTEYVSNLFVTNLYTSTNVISTNTFVTNIYATTIVTTNLFVQNTIITNSTVLYGDSVLLVTNTYTTNINDYITYNYTTNLIDNSVVIITNTTFIINGYTNDLTQLWSTNAAGIYHPTITNTATIFVGQSAQAWWAPTLADGFVSIHDASVGDSQFNSLAIAAIDNVLQENYGQFTSTLGSGIAPAGAMQLLAATNWQNPSAPISKFSVDLQPAYGEVLLDLVNNGIHDFSVSNQITSVQALQLVPLTNITLGLGPNQINVQSNSYVALQSSSADPTTTEIDLSTGLRDGMLLLLKNIGVASGFTLFNGSPLYDDATKYVTLSGGNWATTNYGESILLSGGRNGWSEVKRFGQDTNVLTDQLWANASGMYYPLQPQTSLVSTNISSWETLNSYGALKLLSSSLVVLLAGDNNVDPYYSSSLRLYGFDGTPGNTTVHLGVGNGRGQIVFISSETNALQILNGDTLFNDTSKHLYLSGGDWKPTNNNEMLSLFEIPRGWMEIGRNKINTNIVSGDQLWELVSGHMRTVPDTLDDWQFRYGGVPQVTIYTNGAVVAGPNTPTFWGGPFIRESFVSQHDPFLGDPNFNELWVGTGPTFNDAGYLDFYCATNTANFWLYCITNGVGGRFSVALGYDVVAITSVIQGQNVFTSTPQIGSTVDDVSTNSTVFMDTTALVSNASLLDVRNAGTTKFKVSGNSGYLGGGTKALTDDGTYKSFGTGSGNLSGTLNSPYYPRASGPTTLTDGALYAVSTNVALDGQFIFGQGTTNVLYRNGSHLVYTNGAANVDMQVINGSGKQALFGINSGGQVEVRAGTGVNSVSVSDGTDLLTLFNGSFVPASANISLGSQANPWVGLYVNNIADINGTLSVTNGIVQQVKDSFSTNYVIGANTNQQFFLLNGTNQLVTLPAASGVKGIIYRFSMTNGLGSFVITNAADGAKIRDGVSMSYTNIGVNEVGFMSDGSNWWLASKGKQIFPSASWSLTNTISPAQDTITNIPFTTLEFNNSQGIALRTKAGFTGATELAITNAGTYLITFSAVLKGAAGGSVISIWLRKDGADLPRTRTDQGFTGTSAQQCMTVNYFVSVGTTPSYFELCAASHDATPPTIVSAGANPTGYTAPAMPGVIVTINRVSDTWP